jgi:hypothetical protein
MQFGFVTVVAKHLSFACGFCVSLYSIYVFIQYINIVSRDQELMGTCVPFNSSTSSFSWTFLMAYSEARLESNSDKASSFFRPF